MLYRLIIGYIIYHARHHGGETKVFLSANHKEFGKKEVQEVLQNNNVSYFSNTQNSLGWLNSQLI